MRVPLQLAILSGSLLLSTQLAYADVLPGYSASEPGSFDQSEAVRTSFSPEPWHPALSQGVTDGQSLTVGPTVHEPSLCQPDWPHDTGWFGEFLLLRARDVDIPYATPVDGPILNPVPLGPSSVVGHDYSPGFRVGRTQLLDCGSSLTATFSYYRSDASDSLSLPGGTGWVRPEVTHPNTPAADFDKLAADARYEIDFQIGDIVYQSRLLDGCGRWLDYVAGVRYAHLDQVFESEFSILGIRTVDTAIQFDGIGGRFGLEGEQSLKCGFRVYGQAFANILAGAFSAEYTQNFNLAGLEASASVEDHRLVPQLELEFGLGWQNRSGRFRVRAGYFVGSWFNLTTTPAWLDAVQRDDLDDATETLTFDGLAARVEYRF